jgi:hypothetical protein
VLVWSLTAISNIWHAPKLRAGRRGAFNDR